MWAVIASVVSVLDPPISVGKILCDALSTPRSVPFCKLAIKAVTLFCKLGTCDRTRLSRVQRTPFGMLGLALASALSPRPREGGGGPWNTAEVYVSDYTGLHSQPSGGFQRRLAELCAADIARGLWKTALGLKTMRTTGLNALIDFASEPTGTDEMEKGSGQQG